MAGIRRIGGPSFKRGIVPSTPRPTDCPDAIDSAADRIRAAVLRGIALNRTPGYHFPINFIDISFDFVSRERTQMSIAPGPHIIDATGHVHMGALAQLADLSMSASVRAGRDPSTRTATVSMSIHLTGARPEDRLESQGGTELIVPDGRGEQAMTRFVMRSGDTPIAYGGGGFMVLDPPPGVKLIPVPMRKQSDPEPTLLAPDDLTEPEARIFAQGESMLARAADDGVAFIDRFWGGSAIADDGGASATLDNGAHIANRVKHVQGGILFGFAVSTADAALAATGSGAWRMTAAMAAFIAPGEGEQLQARSQIVHRGRLTAMVKTAVTRPDGRLVLDLTSHHAALA